MITKKNQLTIFALVFIFILTLFFRNDSVGLIPLTGNRNNNFDLIAPTDRSSEILHEFVTWQETYELEKNDSLDISNFKSAIIDGDSEIIRGIYVESKFALQVVQQPSGKPGFVSTIDGVATQFRMAEQFNVIGLLAHNYLSGAEYSSLLIGDVIKIIYGDGFVATYSVVQVEEFQALQPNSAFSKFRDIQSEEILSSTNLFKRVYQGDHHLTLQTCIQNGEEKSWGRLFIIAEKI